MTVQPTDVITTIRLTGNPSWSACELIEPKTDRQILLVQDETLSVGIMGTAEQLHTMAERIIKVVRNPLTATSVLSKIGASQDG